MSRKTLQALTRTRLLVGGALVIVIVGVILAITNAFGSSPPAANADNGASTSTTTVERRDLSSQTQQSATLGYANTATIAIPPGTAPTAVQQAQQQSDSASQSLQSAQATLVADQLALTQARAAFSAGQRKLTTDCNGDNAGGATTTPCAADTQAAASEQQAVAQAKTKVDADQRAVDSARSALDSAGQSLASAQSSASTYGQTSVYTMLPPVGRIVHRSEPLYAIDGQATLLLYGAVPASRAFESGMTSGADVAELNANLGVAGDAFTGATQAAIEALQAKRGLAVTGKFLLGSVVFEPSAVRVTSVTPTVGGGIQAGPVLGITSTKRIVTIELDASAQTSVKLGDAVVITLPDNSTTPGHVTYVGTVATTPSSDNGNGSSSPTIEVDVTPDHPAATGHLDQAPVNVSITTETVRNVLVVPVNALLALAGGGYALEVVGANGIHSLEAVQLGLFDDADGLVQVSGQAVHVGQRVVVPASS